MGYTAFGLATKWGFALDSRFCSRGVFAEGAKLVFRLRSRFSRCGAQLDQVWWGIVGDDCLQRLLQAPSSGVFNHPRK